MKNRFLKPVGGLAAVLVLAFCALQAPVASQTPPATISTNFVTSTQATGHTGVLLVAGYSNCTVFAFDSGASGTITVYGSSNKNPQFGDGTWFANANFNSTGSIVLTTTPVATSGNIANQPTGFYVSWAGESGTITLYATCTTAQASNVTTGGITGTVAISPQPIGVYLSPSPAPWPTTTPGGVPLLTYTKPNGVFHFTTSSTTGCQLIYAGTGALYDLINVSTAQTVGITLYDEATATCTAADQIYNPTMGTAQVIFFGPFGHGFTNGLVYQVVTASITGGGVWLDYSKQQL